MTSDDRDRQPDYQLITYLEGPPKTHFWSEWDVIDLITVIAMSAIAVALLILSVSFAYIMFTEGITT